MDSDEIEAQKSFMERMLQTYDSVHNDRYWNEINPYISQKAEGRGLDIGCGPGLLLQDLIKRYDSQMLYGIDLSQVMLDKASEILRKEVQEGRVELVHQHMQQDHNLPVGLDIIFSSRVLRSFNDQLGIMEAIHKSLNKNGKFVLLDWDLRSIEKYNNYFQKSSEFNRVSLEDVIRLHRNFSQYGIEDWVFILTHSGFKIDYTFQLNEVHIVLIASKK